LIKCTHCPLSIIRMHITIHRNSQIRSVGINVVDSIRMLIGYFWAFSRSTSSYINTQNMLYMMTVDVCSLTCNIWYESVNWVNIAFLVHMYPYYMLHVELWEPNGKSSSLPVDRKYQKGQSRDNYIILWFNAKYKRKWMNVIFLHEKHNSNAVTFMGIYVMTNRI